MHSLMNAMTSMRALLLNSSYEPMRVVSWQKAMILWFQGKVDILEYHSIFARSARSSFQLPSVLKLRAFVRPRPHGAIRFCRENVYIRDGFICQYCRVQFSTKILTLDHVVPVSHQGKRSWTNVVTACRECNQKKANRTPDQALMPLIREPRMPSWLPFSELELRQDPVPTNWRQYLRFKAG
jgi:5-methylcytosine-specific restriction endonuclease McrA